MARTGITFEQVAAAADALLGAGKQATIQAVRESLGTGSPNTVHKHLTAWRAARPQAVSAAIELPADLVNALGAEIARAAAKARSEVESQLVQAQTEGAELSAAGEVLEAERDDLGERVTALTTERDQALATATERGLEIERQVETIKREQLAAESARVELAKAQLKIEASVERGQELSAEIERLRASLEVAQVGRQQAEQQAAVSAAQLVSEQAKSTDLASRLAASEKAIHEAQKAAQASIQKANEAAEKAKRETEAARIAEQAVQARLESAAREITDLKDGLKEARTEAKKATAEASELRGMMTASKAEKAEKVAK